MTADHKGFDIAFHVTNVIGINLGIDEVSHESDGVVDVPVDAQGQCFDLGTPNAVSQFIGSATIETRDAMGDLVLKNLEAFFSKNELVPEVK